MQPAVSNPSASDHPPPAVEAHAQDHTQEHGAHGASGFKTALVIGALGVVFGDIGTSPLYAMKECIDPTHGVAPTH
ncbi:MAG TPA: KUP/HAK/KT family potassium transporter, partial [Polyangiaceae bacterium]